MSASSNDEDQSCYGPGSIALSVILTIFLTLLLLYIFYIGWKRWKQKKEKHLVLETDPERGKNSYAFDNDGFSDLATPYDHTLNSSKVESMKSKWSQWSPMSAFLMKNEKQKAFDDSVTQVNEIQTVLLKSQDFTGLGFNIYGNMRDGIFIKDVLHRGPALESGKLNSGDRIKSVTINFDHIVYEDALTILSYASPYEVIIKSQRGKTNVAQTPPAVPLGHPLYRSSSSSDIIGMHTKWQKSLVYPGEVTTLEKTPSHSSIKVTQSRATTLEAPVTLLSASNNHESMKSQLEQQMLQNHKYQLQLKEEEASPDIPLATKTSKQENKYPKFGIKVLPVHSANDVQQISPKINETSQNDNNINLEIHSDSLSPLEVVKDEVNNAPIPPVRKSSTPPQTLVKEEMSSFSRSNNGSGIKRDKDGIPQEIPSHMLNAAISAKRNRRGTEQIVEDVKSPKKPKGRAPAPPEAKTATNYETDSDVEMDELSVNNIELKPNDITIHQSEDIENIQNRKTASTGDLTKVHKKRKTSTGTLERAQSLDITDTGLPSLTKKHSIDTESEESLLGKVLADPRLSLTLEGLNTFQRSKLKKSSEWGNLEDAILDLDADKQEPIQVQEVVEPLVLTSNTSIVLDQSAVLKPKINPFESTEFLNAERSIAEWDPYYKRSDNTTYGTNASDDVKVSRHHDFNSNISNITINSNSEADETNLTSAEFYVTALDNDNVTIEGPTSLTVQINESALDETPKSPSYITEIQVLTPVETPIEVNRTVVEDKLDVEKELHKIQELADEQLKKLPEMRFSTTSYENQKGGENYTSQIEQLRSNFEKSPSKTSLKLDTGGTSKSRIPVATIKTPPTSPERRDSRNFDLEVDKDIVAIMSSPIHSTPKYQPKATNRNVSVTSIRTSSKIPSAGLPNRPPIPPRKYDYNDGGLSTNGNSHSTFKQWVFNPSDSTVTNITVSETKFERK
ncbi:hypothetical protein RI129_010826 [Pyrocoelia pectoralis]|uniref:PDZ domain-containing protein n=1 Tax=Pyrocoelia pectoralis TaxID=417401 RepID=A0AAN7UZK6_9COLE